MGRTYSTVEVARRLGVSVQSVQRWVDTGRVRAWITPGGHRRIDAQDAEALFREQTTQPSDPDTAPAAARSAPAVLIVDDNPLDRELAVLRVREALPGAAITTASSGFEALMAVGQRAFDAVISDVVMPHMNGFEMLRHIAAQAPNPPRFVIATSNHSLSELRAMGTLPANATFMPKPLEASALSRWARGRFPRQPAAVA